MTSVVDSEISPTTLVQPTTSIASLYVGDLSPEVTEPQLLDLFQTCGTVLQVRILRDIITRRSLGYGYVNFQNSAEAEKALETLNFKEVGDRHIRLMYQQRDPSARYSGNGNIFVKNLEDSIDSKGLHDLFKNFGSILSCKVATNDDGTSRRYGFVHFKEDDNASAAIEKMNGDKDRAAEDSALYVAQFIRRNLRIAALMRNFTNVYIKQVFPTVDKDAIESFFSRFGGITSICVKTDKKGRVFAFCNFAQHDTAVKAIEESHDKPADGLTDPADGLYVQRAQPRNERLVELRSKYMQRQSLGNNLYVRNFSQEYSDEDLKELFAEYGEIRSCKVMTNPADSTSRGFGFVSFVNAEQANNALREMNGRMLNGKPLVVNIAQRRDQRYSMLQLQFQQRIQALMRQQPMMPFVAGGQPQRKGMRQQPAAPQQPVAQAGQQAPNHPNRQVVRRGPETPQYTVSRTPQASPAIAPDTPSLAPISEAELSSMPENDRKAALGERLFVKVSEFNPELAPKITGMFLEMPLNEAFELLDNSRKLQEKIKEATYVIHSHQSK